MPTSVKQYIDNWAYDISKNVISKGEIYDVEAINQSIEMIIATFFGERLFLPSFGCTLGNALFEIMTEDMAEGLLDEIISAIRQWEDRVVVLDNLAEIIVDPNQHSIILTIPYMIRKNYIQSSFEKKIIF